MKAKILIVFVLLIVLGCQEKTSTTSPLLEYVPQNTSALIKINDYQTFKSELKNSHFIKKLEKTTIHNSLYDKIKGLDNIQPISESILAFVEVGKENFEFIFLTASHPDFFQLENLTDKSSETLTYENRSYNKYVLDGVTFFSLPLDQNIIISSSQLVLENLIRTQKNNAVPQTLQKLYQVSDSNKSATLFINTANSHAIISSLLDESSKMNSFSFSDWVSLDLNIGQDHVNLNGISMANDSLNHYVNLFKNTKPLLHTTPSIAPLNAKAILSYTFDDYSEFAKNQQKYLDRSTPVDTIFNTVEEIGFIHLNSSKGIILKTYGSENISQFVQEIKNGSSDYQGNEIITLNSPDFLNQYFNPIIEKYTANYCSILENTFVFSEDRETLQTIISNYKNGATFNKTPVYITSREVMADESTMLFVSNSSGIEQVLEKDFTATLTKDVRDADLSEYTFASQLVADDDFYHTSFSIQKIEKQSKTNTTSPLFTVQLDADIATNPQFVTNHRTNKKEIAVQDIDNNLYLISTEGKVLWKKQLQSKIVGNIQQVDIYKNGRLQLAFTTNNQFMILDRNGKEVEPFNKTYEGGNVNPLSVFDYEGQKNYRFVVTQGRKTFMYNGKGEIVGGFTYTTASDQIIGAPKHLRIGKKDYLLYKLGNNSLKILNRVGKDRLTIQDKIDFSDNDIYLYKNKFTLTDKKGVLHQIDANGKITRANFNLNNDHGIDATSKSLVVMNDNILTIKGKKVELDLGVYTKPKIFYIYDKIYVSVTDIQNQKIHLYDSQAKPIQNFPVYGNSLIDLVDMDNDRKLEFVAKDLENSIIVYKMN